MVLRELRLVEGIEKALLLVTVDRDLMEQASYLCMRPSATSV